MALSYLMPQPNFERMIKLAEEFFDAKSDPDQISMTPEEAEKLERLHPATMMEESTEEGPVAWMLLVPTTHDLMEQFIRGEINEKQLLEKTPAGEKYDAVYLCSALVLPEYRGKGLAFQLASEALASMLSDHPIKELFFWCFSTEGDSLAKKIAGEFGMTLYERNKY